MKSHWILAFFLIGMSFSGCDFEYWTTRGQPPSVEELLTRAQSNLDRAQQERGSVRAELAPISSQLRDALLGAAQNLKGDGNRESVLAQIEKARSGFKALEGKVSIGSRAALGQLSGQLRALSVQAKAGELDYAAFGLFSARTFNFLAGEFEVPAPAFG